MKKKIFFTLLLSFAIWQNSIAQIDLPYQTPPQAIADLLNALPTPNVSISPTKDWMLLSERTGFASIAELAQPELRLAGLRLNPRNNGKSRSGGAISYQLQNIATQTKKAITGLPADALFQTTSWSPDGQKFAFTCLQDDGISLWYVDVKTFNATQLTQPILNDAIGSNFIWTSDSKTLICKQIPAERANLPATPLKPEGAIIQETAGKKAVNRTYQDLLKNKHDERVFEYYATSQLVRISLDKHAEKLGAPAIYTNFFTSPNANYILTSAIISPYSYLVPMSQFPLVQEIWDKNGVKIKEINKLPLAEDIAKGFDAVRKGMRGLSWRADKPAMLTWVEALDDGDPAKDVPFRDQLFFLDAPFTSTAQASVQFPMRFQRISWGNGEVAIAYQARWKDRKSVTTIFSPDKPSQAQQILYDRSSEDRYSDPGDFLVQMNAQGKSVLLIHNEKLFLNGSGASPEGDKPFLDEYDLKTRKAKRLWQSKAPYYENIVVVIDAKKNTAITSRESKEENANYYLTDWKAGKATALTAFPHPYPQLKGIEKQTIKYKRKDGLDLQGNLYLPKDWKKGDAPLPMLMWAYPDEFKSKDAAGQVQGSPYQFTSIYYGSPLYWVTQGYAILDDASMPIVGEGKNEPNDTFMEQLVANAEAPISYLAEQGVIDRKRVAVGGHSYGAFMTANLLTHSDLFAAGIARSGAYNRTLTPFGFQSEERTYWESPTIYFDMAPFSYADKMNKPLLLIHGEADNNTGTFPIQSERYYNALKGLGKVVRYVVLPHESHGYQAKESIMHMAWEMSAWLDKYVKNPKPKTEK